MSDDTRDIVIETRADVRNLTEKVEGMSEKLDGLCKRANEQDGMVRVGRIVIAGIGFAGGAAAGFITKLLPFTGSIPK